MNIGEEARKAKNHNINAQQRVIILMQSSTKKQNQRKQQGIQARLNERI